MFNFVKNDGGKNKQLRSAGPIFPRRHAFQTRIELAERGCIRKIQTPGNLVNRQTGITQQKRSLHQEHLIDIVYYRLPGNLADDARQVYHRDIERRCIEGDVTYCDAALKANKLSIVFEDKDAARTTLDRVRDFISHNPTVYLSTHCPEGYENLELKRIMKI